MIDERLGRDNIGNPAVVFDTAIVDLLTTLFTYFVFLFDLGVTFYITSIHWVQVNTEIV